MNIATDPPLISTVLKLSSDESLYNIKPSWSDVFLEVERNNSEATVLQSISTQDPLDLQLDTFEILCQKATDITRTMQDYHMDELIKRPPSIEHPSSFQSASTITELYDDDLEEDLEDEDEFINWREAFLQVMSSIVAYSEELETLSTDLLSAKTKVHEFVLLEKSLFEKYEQQEQIYKDRLLECEQVSQQQNLLIEHLVDLNRYLDTSLTDNKHFPTISKSTVTGSSTTLCGGSIKQHSTFPFSDSNCWSEHSLSPFLKPTTQGHRKPKKKNANRLESLRWELAHWIGGGVGSGRVMHSFEGPVNGMDIIITGSGALMSPDVHHYGPSTSSKITATESLNQHLYRYQQAIKSSTSSSSSSSSLSSTSSTSIQHLTFQHHQYMIHITQNDRINKFNLLPKSLWIPDKQVNSCQFNTRYATCSTQFSFINRRHHCRKCGRVVCQRHSLNRLPLFSYLHTKESWHRVCDECFYNIVIVTPSSRQL